MNMIEPGENLASTNGKLDNGKDEETSDPSAEQAKPGDEALEILEPSEYGDESKKEEGSKHEEGTSSLNAAKDKISTVFSTKGFISLVQDNHITLKNAIIALVTFGLQLLTSSQVFDCPLKGCQLYGNCFLYVPAFILFCANMLITGQVWQISGRCFIARYRRRGEVIARLIPLGLVKATVGPAVWLITCFANGTYFICATVGPDATKRNLTDPQAITALEDDLDAARGLSHILAWVVFGTVTGLGTTFVVVKECYLKDHVLINNLYMFERREATGAMHAFEKVMRGEDIDTVTQEQKEKTTHDYGDGDVFDYHVSGIPENNGKETVRKIFQEECHNYSAAYRRFSSIYPRVVTGNPAQPWVEPNRDHCDGTRQPCVITCCYRQRSESQELQPVELEHLMSTAAASAAKDPMDFP